MPLSSSSDDSQQIDPILLRRLFDRLMQMRAADVSVRPDEVLEELHPSIRGSYESPLREMISESETKRETSQDDSEDFSDDHTREEEWTVDLPTGFKAEPLDLPPPTRPRAKSRGGDGEDLPEYVGKFRVKRELGRGANGVVYLGFDEELERNVAIKLSLVAGDKLQEKLRVEASKAAQVDADGIVPVYHIGATDEGAVYIVQKYIEGSTLRSLLKNGGPLSPARGVLLIREIAAALQPAHLQDILHRDLKPDNILIDQLGKAWISDFGLAISEEEQQGRRCELAGTPVYMSPEQIKGRIDFLDPRSDIWGLGVMYYEVLTGKLPFNGTDRKSLTEQICERDPRPMQQRAPGHLTPEMNQIFERCCAKKPSDRFASTAELIYALDELIDSGLSEHNINGQFVSSVAAETWSGYGSTTARDTLNMRATEATYRTERMATGRATMRGSIEHSQEKPKPLGKIMLSGVALLTIAAGIAAIFYRPDRVDPVTPPINPQPRPTITPPPVQADGSADLPWLIASDGSGSHRSIQKAINEPGEGHVIHVLADDLSESLDIREAVTIIGMAENKACTIRTNDKTVINVNCPRPTQLVTLKNLTIRGLGRDETSPFNTIDVANSALTIVDCEIESRTQNSIKARGGSIDVSNSVFQAISGSHAISLTDHEKAVIKNCQFFSDGVELTRGDGTIVGCRFQQGVGISTHLSGGTPLYINDCHFSECNVGLSVNNQVEVIVASDCSFDHCDWGVMMHSIEDSPLGRLRITSATFNQCNYDAIYVAGGILDVDRQCTITDCTTGIFVEYGTANLLGVHLSGGSIAAMVGVRKKDDLGSLIIREGDASLTLTGVECRNAAYGFRSNHPRGSCHIDRTKFIDNTDAGIFYETGELRVKQSEFSGGQRGFIAFGEDRGESADGELIRSQVIIESSSFGGHSECDAEAIGAIELHLKDCQLSDDNPNNLRQSPSSIIHHGLPSA